MKNLLALVLVLVLMVLSAIVGFYNAWLFMDMWKWFIVPIGAPELSFWAIYGLTLVIAWPLVATATKVQNIENILEEQKNGIKNELDSALHTLSRGFGTLIGGAIGYSVIWFVGKLVFTYGLN